ncbi:Molydopterin dinucleotide binding domain protein [uncultured archaeon]|nr:Molydopterin dinucleotide binding domain protein [uncultured archaeon]
MEIEMTVVAFQDIFQNEARKKGLYTDEFRQLSAQIILDKQDMNRLGVKDGQRVLVKNEVGGVVVAAKTSDDDPHPGLAFMINSPWYNQLVRDDACDASIPGFKRIAARVSFSEESATQVSEILQRMRA